MSKTPHKYANVIKAWADGEVIQWTNSELHYKDQIVRVQYWIDLDQDKNPDFNSSELEWRIKPVRYSGKFRVAFYRGVPGFSDYNLYIVHEQFVKDAEQDELFVQWLTHWVEFNVDVSSKSN